MEKSLSLIVPAHNSAKFIESSLKKYNKFFASRFTDYEIIVVCNACSDNTFEIVDSLKHSFPLVVIDTERKGKGNAIEIGFKFATKEIVGFIDADDPYDLDEVYNMMKFLNDFDMTIVTKFKDISKYQTNFTRRFFSLAGALTFKILFGTSFKDTQAGAKFMNRGLLKKFKKKFICSGFEFDMELLYEASKLKAKIKEYHIPPREVEYSTVKARILPGLVYRLLKMRLFK